MLASENAKFNEVIQMAGIGEPPSKRGQMGERPGMSPQVLRRRKAEGTCRIHEPREQLGGQRVSIFVLSARMAGGEVMERVGHLPGASG